MNLDVVADDSIDAIRQKERMYEEAIRSGDYLDGRFWADAWCGAFVWKKTVNSTTPSRKSHSAASNETLMRANLG